MSSESKTRADTIKSANASTNSGVPGKNGSSKARKVGSSDRSNVIRKAKKSNDPAWYAKSPEMMTSASSVNFYQPAGKELDVLGLNTLDAEVRNSLISVPGVLQINYAPGIGYSDSPTSAASIAARSLYNDVRHVQSGHSNYDAPDLMMYVIAAANAYAYLFWMRRIYGTIRLFNANNQYMPRALLRAMGASENILNEGFNLYWYIQEYTAKLSAFCYPSGMPFFDRYNFMNEHVYLDSAVNKGGMYVFRPLYFWRYDEYGTPGKGRLVAEAINGNYDLAAIKAYGDKLVGSLSDSEDCYIMSGDILKAYGGEIYKVDVIGLDYTVDIRLDLEVLEQIHNATVWGGEYVIDASQEWGSGPASGVIDQDVTTGALLYGPKVRKFTQMDDIALESNRLLSLPTDDTKPEFIMTSTRLMSFGNVVKSDDMSGLVPDAKDAIAIDCCGTEIITGLVVFWYQHETSTGNWVLTQSNPLITFFAVQSYWTTGSMTTAALGNALAHIDRVRQFDFHPFISLWIYDEETHKKYRTSQAMELENYTTVDKLQVSRMHETALLSLFDVPSFQLTVKR